MNLTEQQRITLERLGSNFFSAKQCAAILEIEQVAINKEMRNENSEIFKAYYKGYYTSLLKLRESIMELAMRGSGPAQLQMIKIIELTDSSNQK